MKIDNFEVSNFKSIRDSGQLEIGKFSIFIGKNDVGKSSFLEALEIFLSEGKPEDAHFHKGEEEEICMKAKLVNVPEEITENLSNRHSPSSGEIVVRRDFERRDGKTPSDKTFVNGEKLKKGSITLEDDRKTGAQSRKFIWKHMPEPIFIPSERNVAEETKLKRGTLLNDILYPILKKGRLEELDSIGEAEETMEEALSETSDSIAENITERMKEYMPDLEETEIQTSSLKLEKAFNTSILLKDRYTPHSVEVSERGSGIGDLLILSLMQTYVDHQVGSGYCLLFEEPGGSLHPGAERKMFEALKKISEEGGQVLITSHSQVFIDKTEKAKIFSVKREDGESRFERKEEDLFGLIDEIGARKSDLLLTDFVIYTEGPSDASILGEIANRTIENWGEYNVVIQPLGGSGNIEHCEPKDLKRINNGLAILLDSHRRGEEDEPCSSASSFKEKCDEIGTFCHILERHSIENYFSEEIVNNYFDIDLESINPYDTDVAGRINDKLEEKHGEGVRDYNKVRHGREIVKEMYREDKHIPEIESFLEECLS